ncbi:MAG TPA: ABC transporter substrate-binding protein [Actinomycetota bacterium]|nr:ABC transporter substrate-binding protein [Actinomycetota bacterium]
MSNGTGSTNAPAGRDRDRGGEAGARRSGRRSITRTALALLAALTLAATACTGDGGDDEPSPSGTGGGEAVRNPDTIVHAADDEPLSLDPAQAEPGEGGESVILQVYERLVEFSPEGPELVPGLATEVPSSDNGGISEDGLTYTFPIRTGVTFHDGSPLTADDVKFSWDRVLEMGLPESNAGLLADTVAETAAPDDETFEVTLTQPNAAFLNSVATQSVASVVSREVVEANGGIVAGEPNEYMTTNPVGTGPYRFVEWNRGENMLFEINEDYWGEPANKDLRFEIVPDPDVRVLGLRAGDYDSIETDPSFVGDVEGADGVEIFAGEYLLEPIHIGMNLNIPEGALPPEDTIPTDFFHDVRVRQAFNYAFDYQGFIDGALGGYGAPVPHYFPQGVLGYSEDMPVYEQDLARAEELFREAGWWDRGFTVSVITEEANLFEVAALVLKDSLEGLNENFRVRVLAVAEAQFDEAHAQDPLEYAMWVKNADPYADPHAFLRDYAHPDGAWGEVHGFANGYEDPERIASMIDEASVTTDPDERVAIYSELAQILYDDPMWVIAGNETALNAHRSWLQGFVMNPLWPRPSLKFALFDK